MFAPIVQISIDSKHDSALSRRHQEFVPPQLQNFITILSPIDFRNSTRDRFRFFSGKPFCFLELFTEVSCFFFASLAQVSICILRAWSERKLFVSIIDYFLETIRHFQCLIDA